MMKKNPLIDLYEKLSHPHHFGLQDENAVKAVLLQEFKRAGWNPLIDNSTHNLKIAIKSQKSGEFDAHIASILLVINVKEKTKTDLPLLAILTIFEFLLRLQEAKVNREWMDLQIRIETDLPNSSFEYKSFKNDYDRELCAYKDLYLFNITDLGMDPWCLSLLPPIQVDPFTDLLKHIAIQHKIQIELQTLKPLDRSNLKSLGSILAKNKHIYCKFESLKNKRESENGDPITIAFNYSLFLYDLLLLLDKRISEKIESAE